MIRALPHSLRGQLDLTVSGIDIGIGESRIFDVQARQPRPANNNLVDYSTIGPKTASGTKWL